MPLKGSPNSETYLVLSGIGAKDSKRDLIEVSSSGAKTRLKVTGDKQHNYFGKEGEALNLGYQEEAQTECTLYFKEARTFYLDDVSIQCVGMDYLEEQISERKEESLEDIQVSTNRITGKITTTGTKVLQLSLPLQQGMEDLRGRRENRDLPHPPSPIRGSIWRRESMRLWRYTPPHGISTGKEP